LHVPPLRQRREDVPVLANHFLLVLAAQRGRGVMTLSPEAEAALARHAWPGNIRELRNVVERVVLLCRSETVGPEDLGLNRKSEAGPPHGVDTNLTLDELERRQILAVMQEENGRVERAAKRLGLHRSSLYGKLKKYAIPQP
jgi:DNA-binding NtrC family response regulator